MHVRGDVHDTPDSALGKALPPCAGVLWTDQPPANAATGTIHAARVGMRANPQTRAAPTPSVLARDLSDLRSVNNVRTHPGLKRPAPATWEKLSFAPRSLASGPY